MKVEVTYATSRPGPSNIPRNDPAFFFPIQWLRTYRRWDHKIKETWIPE